jgi:hypothetical protein
MAPSRVERASGGGGGGCRRQLARRGKRMIFDVANIFYIDLGDFSQSPHLFDI